MQQQDPDLAMATDANERLDRKRQKTKNALHIFAPTKVSDKKRVREYFVDIIHAKEVCTKVAIIRRLTSIEHDAIFPL